MDANLHWTPVLAHFTFCLDTISAGKETAADWIREEEQDENPSGQAGSFTHTLLFHSAFPNLAGKAIAVLKGLFLATLCQQLQPG